MSFTHTLTRAINDGAASYSFADVITSGEAIALDQAILTAQTDQLLAFSFTKTKLKSIVMWSDQVMRVCTNAIHSGAPQETINLAANVPLLWSASDPLVANPFAGNVTALYVTNTASGLTATLHVRIIMDPT